jgi:hypothetical protein
MGRSGQSKNLPVVEDSSPTSGLLTFLTFLTLSRGTSSPNVSGNKHLLDSRGHVFEILSAHGARKPSDHVIGQ